MGLFLLFAVGALITFVAGGLIIGLPEEGIGVLLWIITAILVALSFEAYREGATERLLLKQLPFRSAVNCYLWPDDSTEALRFKCRQTVPDSTGTRFQTKTLEVYELNGLLQINEIQEEK